MYYKADNNIEECVTEVIKKISDNTSKNINLFLSLDIDKNVLLETLLERISEDYDNIIILTYDNLYSFYTDRFNKKVKIYKLEKLLHIGSSSNDLLILLDQRANERLELLLASNIEWKKALTVGTPALEKKDIEALRSLGLAIHSVNEKEHVRKSNSDVGKALILSGKPYLVYGLNSILDVRDIDLADENEKKSLQNILDEECLHFKEQFALIYKQLQNINCNVNDLAGDVYKNKRMCIGLLELIRFYQQLLGKIGIEQDAVLNAFLSLQCIKEEYGKELNSQDENERFEARKKVQDAVNERLVAITKHIVTVAKYDAISELLENKLSESVWKKLSQESKQLLITAELNYQMLSNYPKQEECDFSGVCLLMSKAIEIELFEKLFKRYKDYLEKGYTDVSKWPYSMTKKIGSVEKRERDDNEFTLGTVSYILGLDKNGVLQTGDKNYKSFSVFAPGKFLNCNITSEEIKEIAFYIATTTRKITEDYRNPSAHKDIIRLQKAEECRQYMLDVEKAIKKILKYVLKNPTNNRIGHTIVRR